MNDFVKSHGLGNDYIVMDSKNLSFELTPERIRLICDRHFGIGSDGVLLLVPSERADFGLRIFNPDGSEAEKSGNGIRIFSKFLYDHGYTRRRSFSIETIGGDVDVELTIRDGKVSEVSAMMGRVSFMSDMIPVSGDLREVVGERIEVGGDEIVITALSIGNPHCVVFVEDLNSVEIEKLGPAIENHPLFPKRTNVQFARVISREEVEVAIWERGVGETLASGSSACAVASAALKNGLVDRKVRVRMKGGSLLIEIRGDWEVWMSGPASEIYEGRLSEEFVEKLIL